MDVKQLEYYMQPGRRCHMVGIGGVSMSPLAQVLQLAGLIVTGSDMNEGSSVEHLRSLGIRVDIGHRAENVAGADFIIRTAAARDDNVEIGAAREAGIPVFERAQGWGYIMRRYRNALCIAGTHGKTTTTSMLTHILMEAGKDPTVMIGGTLPMLGSGYRVGEGDTIVLESCEYYNSFLNFSPTVAVILNVEADHLDFFRDLDDVKSSFRRFASLVPEETGTVVANADDPNTVDVVRGIGRKVVTFSCAGEGDMTSDRVEIINGCYRFDAAYRGAIYAHIELRIPGIHNMKNALAACAAAAVLGIPASAVERGLASFTGAGRRFEYKGEYAGAKIYDDYAHHPGELHALFDAVAGLGYRRVLAVFQPHTYSRTKALFDDFVNELSRPDKVLLAEIYAAREKNTIGISSADLAERIPNACFCPTFEDAEALLRREASPGDLILTIGAGDVYRIGEALVRK